MADEPLEPLRRIEERLERAAEAAERMISEAGRRPPPAGWQVPAGGDGGVGGGGRVLPELEALVAAVASLRELVPPDVTERLMAAIKEVLLALRALLDYHLERLDRKPPPPAEVQDIPID
jgi:hypothetical protein